MYQGVARGGGPIHEVLQDLFMEKYEDEQPEFVDNYEREMTGDRKGNFSRGAANPGHANDTDALESFNDNFKEDGTVRKQFSIDGGDGIIKVLSNYIHTTSAMDVEFEMHPTIKCDDWRQAQLAIKRDSMSTYMSSCTTTLANDGAREVCRFT